MSRELQESLSSEKGVGGLREIVVFKHLLSGELWNYMIMTVPAKSGLSWSPFLSSLLLFTVRGVREGLSKMQEKE